MNDIFWNQDNNLMQGKIQFIIYWKFVLLEWKWGYYLAYSWGGKQGRLKGLVEWENRMGIYLHIYKYNFLKNCHLHIFINSKNRNFHQKGDIARGNSAITEKESKTSDKRFEMFHPVETVSNSLNIFLFCWFEMNDPICSITLGPLQYIERSNDQIQKWNCLKEN